MNKSFSISLLAPIEPYSNVTGSHSGDGLITYVRSLFELADIAHLLTNDYAKADIILVLEPCIVLDYKRYAMLLASNPIIRAHPERCYTYNSLDRPWPILPGMYVSLSNKISNEWLHCGGPHIHYPNELVFESPESFSNVSLRPEYLACFRGSLTSKLRVKLLNAAERKILPPEIRIAKSKKILISNGKDIKRSYCDEIRQHAFSLAPAGHGPSSFRLYESMALGRAPVIIADSWISPKGINWNKCSLLVPERDILDLGNIINQEMHRCDQLGTKARREYIKNFSPASVMKYITWAIDDLHHRMPYPQNSSWRLNLIEKTAQSAPTVPWHLKIVRYTRKIAPNLLRK